MFTARAGYFLPALRQGDGWGGWHVFFWRVWPGWLRGWRRGARADGPGAAESWGRGCAYWTGLFWDSWPWLQHHKEDSLNVVLTLLLTSTWKLWWQDSRYSIFLFTTKPTNESCSDIFITSCCQGVFTLGWVTDSPSLGKVCGLASTVLEEWASTFCCFPRLSATKIRRGPVQRSIPTKHLMTF